MYLFIHDFVMCCLHSCPRHIRDYYVRKAGGKIDKTQVLVDHDASKCDPIDVQWTQDGSKKKKNNNNNNNNNNGKIKSNSNDNKNKSNKRASKPKPQTKEKQKSKHEASRNKKQKPKKYLPNGWSDTASDSDSDEYIQTSQQHTKQKRETTDEDQDNDITSPSPTNGNENDNETPEHLGDKVMKVILKLKAEDSNMNLNKYVFFILLLHICHFIFMLCASYVHNIATILSKHGINGWKIIK